MANYEEYAEKHLDPLQEEITNAGENAENRIAENSGGLPDRFQGKTPEEIAASYVELERKFSQQGNDLGQLRNTVDRFMELQSEPTPNEPTPEAEPLTVDDIYEDPDAAVRRVVQSETKPQLDKIAELEAALATERYNAQLDTFDGKYEGWKDQAGSPEFIEWVQGSQARQRLAQMAHAQDLSAADDLMGLWYETNNVSQAQASVQRQSDLRNASLESGGAAMPEMQEGFSRADLMDKRIAAKQGDPTASHWLKVNAEAIAIAYETPGAIRD